MATQATTAVVIHELGNLDSISVEQVLLPSLEENQVLIQIECAPINPIDLMLATGHHGIPPPPKILGFEGSGTVIRSGSHPYAQSLVGKRVAALSPLQGGFGALSEYLVTSAFTVVVLRDSVTFEQGASLLINPLTVAIMIERLKEGRQTSAVFNAAASSLAKMAIRWCQSLNISPICLVKRQEQVDLLASLGVQHVFNTSKDGWKDEAKAVTSQLGTKIGFDCISGTETQDMINLLLDGGTVHVYGSLSGQEPQISSFSLISGDKSIRGLTWGTWFFRLPADKKSEVENEVQDLIGSILKTDFHAEITLDGVKDAIKQYSTKKTDSKFLVRVRKTQ
ncbi:unnamed protein product [Blepharisma stoltei]|uniref:Enoyl reductase (ER) domain-containing protein n=1 Tax=Blepharisma stoltei TaxID=1481888 RepID=A0AAU9IQN2_9CILI|nr:unnamed protein product [Blepharisma stoltei]